MTLPCEHHDADVVVSASFLDADFWCARKVRYWPLAVCHDAGRADF